ncbi:Retrovirus-related Pol polyprotein from transposon opus [Eumeta japonica]|uniref:Retrovirus-related Pol polyprotein from transposon opus n=1 Tax=Eumeta variegata TaxID=151549 RepID=A0A4C1SZ99_EUMVA|nr:Retrovirus-related Pol polyprotein from transposon opus [Eumeta japonica]
MNICLPTKEGNKEDSEYSELFSEPNQKLTCTTKVVGEIRTTTNTPVYSKQYPYPMALKPEVERQIKTLLNDGIIQHSRSPYNSPVWVVGKKPDSQGNKQYRLVIDYRKLNSLTIPDRFVKDYAKLAKPLTQILRGEEGRISKNKSARNYITLNDEAVEAFVKLKNTLASQDIVLAYPDFSKDLELTTDASNFALGAVLSQNNRPIAFISRTLNKAEEHYATNEKEMLAIIWALQSLRNYLYGSTKIKIFTDHQPLTNALSNKNNNNKMKRWKAILEEYNYELFYKPGKTNVVADALSRIPSPTQLSAPPKNYPIPIQH